jgi:dTDP-4-dehydrorhamnose reductase
MARITVLGSNGQLGSDLLKILSQAGHEVIALTRAQINATAANPEAQLDPYAKSDYLVNCIAMTNVDGCEDDAALAFSINTVFVTKLAQFCSKNKIILIQISTDYVFSGAARTPYIESDRPAPLNVYGLSKYAGEVAVQAYSPQHFILRVAALFGAMGASGKGGNFVNTMLRLARENKSIQVIADQWTCPTHTLDVARAINALIQSTTKDFGIYNCVSSTACSWFSFTQAILRLSGLDPDQVKPLSYNEYPFKALRPQYGVLNINKLSKTYIMPSYQQALSEYLQISLI